MTLQWRTGAALVLAFAGCSTEPPSAPTDPDDPTEITRRTDAMGSVRSDGDVSGETGAGDGPLNRIHEAFLRFDLSSIPASATIESVEIDVDDSTILGAPFSWGCLAGYEVDAFPLDATDFSGALPPAAERLFSWCSVAELDAGALLGDTLRLAVEAAAGGPIEMRLQIEHAFFMGSRSNFDGVTDQVQLGAPVLQIT
ncbi:MAG: hypothetical protein AB7P22_11695, partial [Vicinamibacterales bacterium]